MSDVEVLLVCEGEDGSLDVRVVSWRGARVTRAALESLLFDALVASLGTADEPADFRDLAHHIRRHAATVS